MLKTFNFKLIALIAVFTVATAAALYTVNTLVFADSCNHSYGGGKSCKKDVEITKEVRKGFDGGFDKKVTGVKKGELIQFRITVHNTGDANLKDLRVEDVLPEALELIDGDLKRDIEFLDNGDDSKVEGCKAVSNGVAVFCITAKVKDSEFKAGKSACVVNQAKVKADFNKDGNRETKDDSEAEVCYGSELKQLPKTGNEDAVIATLFGLGMIMTGFGLRKATELA